MQFAAIHVTWWCKTTLYSIFRHCQMTLSEQVHVAFSKHSMATLISCLGYCHLNVSDHPLDLIKHTFRG